MFLLTMWTALYMPYRICFLENLSDLLFYIEIGTDCAFGLDILVQFNTGYYDSRNRYINKRKLIAKRYISTWFIIDFISCIPFQFINTDEDSNEDFNKLLRLIRLSRFYRLFKLLRLLKMIRLIRSSSYFRRYIKRIKANYAAGRLISFIFIVIIIIHLISCI